MNRMELARLLDHSTLRPDAAEKDILAQAEIVRQWGIGFFCVQPSYVALAAAALRASAARVVSRKTWLIVPGSGITKTR